MNVRIPEADLPRNNVRAMFARISGVYDTMNHALSLNLDRRWRRNLLRHLDRDVWEVLDLCAGTGDLGLACLDAGKGRLVVAADFCQEMLRAAAHKMNGRALCPAAADALQLPFRDAVFDAVIVGFGVRNYVDLGRGLQEITRVLRPAGQLLVLDFFGDDHRASGPRRGPAPPLRRLLGLALPLAGRLWGRDGPAYAYLARSMAGFLSVAGFAAMLSQAGYLEIFVERQTLGIAHVIGGRRPL
jgi:demethylmenaquinone methyltransferase/2-methoxy-6-polyprenyl-1,4-benzoquinol methylase